MKNRPTVTGFLEGVACLRAAPDFPLKVSENRRYLVDQRGTSFLYTADTPWMLFARQFTLPQAAK